ncbi:tetratricopeptide repeat domain protein [Microscilla marina]|uniref:Tetratricopeptide repeat domain protein n=1 Tax=Microscilla marina ATCC 23134 TaxID=313606 RepID=A1ZYG0_MICM2|nr:tetratricopeptide repeat domain protein [Microscilla marina]EAY24544.1 tetratricopeptide repeat domain protein [Microscilla marina ATCC 23134]
MLLSTTLRLAGLALCLAFAQATYAQTTPSKKTKSPFDSLYAKAYQVGNAQPDSAIHYASQATRASQKPEEQANAHNLLAFYALNQGYYALAIKHYQKAYDLYKQPSQKAVMLKNIAFCYKNAGNYEKATSIAKKTVQNFTTLQDTTNLIEAFNLLANCYTVQDNFGNTSETFKKAIQLTQGKHKAKLANIYDDLARLKENQTQYDSAIHYQRLALERFAEPNAARKCTRLVRLSWYYMLNQNARQARQHLNQALALKQTSPVSHIMLQATHGLLLFVERQEPEARQAIGRSDTLLKHLRQRSSHPIQQKFARKLAYEINQSGYQLLKHLCFYSEQRARFAPHKQWFAERLQYSQQLYEEIQLRVHARDSLVIARTQPKTQVRVVRQISPWWWVVIAATIAIGGLWLYKARAQTIKARIQEVQAETERVQAQAEQVQAQADFVEAMKASPIEGLGDIKPQETHLLQEAAHRLQRPLEPDEVKLLVLVVRGCAYKRIAEELKISEGATKMRAQRLKERLKVHSFQELM